MRYRKLRIAWSVGLVFAYILYPITFGTHDPPFWFTLERYWIGFVPVIAFAAIAWLPWHVSPRTLRIAWSVFWGLSCVLLIVLWVQSYWLLERFMVSSTYNFVTVTIGKGGLIYFFTENPGAQRSWTWGFYSGPVTEIRGTITWIHWIPVDIDSFRVVVPLWIPSLVCGAFASIPWVRPSRRFSLRTLLITTTLVAVVLGVVVYATRQ